MALEDQWCDEAYADTKQKQFHELRTDNRTEILRKMRVCLNARRSNGTQTRLLAKKMYGEIVGMIQDRALDQKVPDKELANRREYVQNAT